MMKMKRKHILALAAALAVVAVAVWWARPLPGAGAASSQNYRLAAGGLAALPPEQSSASYRLDQGAAEPLDVAPVLASANYRLQGSYGYGSHESVVTYHIYLPTIMKSYGG